MGTTVFSSDFYLGYYGIELSAFSGTFLTAANNLSDVASAPDSRTNLDVYSTAQVYSQTQLSTSGSSSVHFDNITSNVWSLVGGDIVASADVDLNTYNLLNVGTVSITNITASGYLAAADFRQTTWNSGQDNSFITVDSADGGFDRLQLMYYTIGTPGLITADLDFDFTEDCTIGTSSGNTLDINSATAIVANTTIAAPSGDGLLVTMGSITPTANYAISVTHRSAVINEVAWPLQLIHLTSGGSMTDDFGVGISFNTGLYGSSEYEIARVNATRDGASNSGALNFWVASSGTLYERVHLENTYLQLNAALLVGENGTGYDTWLYGATGSVAVTIVSNTTSTSAMVDTLVIKAETSGGAPGTGFGPILKFQAGQESPTVENVGQIFCRYDGGTVNTEIGIAPTASGVAQYNLIVGIDEIGFSADFIPDTNDSFDIGSTGYRLSNIYAQDSFNLGTGATTYVSINWPNGIQTDLDIVPFTDDTVDLGGSGFQFQTMWAHSIGSIATPIDYIYASDINATTEITLGTKSSGESAPLEIVNTASGEFAAIFESNSLLNDGNNGILIRAGSAGAGADNDVFIMFENQNGVIVGGIEWTGSAFAFFVGTTPP